VISQVVLLEHKESRRTSMELFLLALRPGVMWSPIHLESHFGKTSIELFLLALRPGVMWSPTHLESHLGKATGHPNPVTCIRME
jgi:hypothetical protein